MNVNTAGGHLGGGALAVQISSANSTSSDGGTITLPKLCATGAALASTGYKGSAWIKLVTADDINAHPNRFITFADTVIDNPGLIIYNDWFQVTFGTNFAFPASVTSIRIGYSAVFGFTGTMYIDNITLGP